VNTLKFEFPDRAAILSHYFPTGRGGLAFAGECPFPVGAPVRVTLRIADPRRTFHLPLRVAWNRFAGSGKVRPEFGLEFVGSDSTLRDRFMNFLSAELPLDRVRVEERPPTNVRVRLSRGDATGTFLAVDFTPGGLFLAMPDGSLPVVGSNVALTIRPPMSLRSIELQARVAWRRDTAEPRGVGLEFIFKSAAEREKVADLAGYLAAREGK
jgi:Tfp pilus assembly protein PilZ